MIRPTLKIPARGRYVFIYYDVINYNISIYYICKEEFIAKVNIL